MFGVSPPMLGGGGGAGGLRDLSSHHWPFTVNGTVARATSGGPYADGICAEFNNASWLSLAPGAAGVFSGPSTVEFYMYANTSAMGDILRAGDESSNRAAFTRYTDNSMRIDNYGLGFVLTGGSVANSTWAHVAFEYDALGDVELWVNGIYITFAAPVGIWGNANGMEIGSRYAGGSGLVGKISGLRISTSLRYTYNTNFTVPTTRFTPDANTFLLTSF